jgi:hypothetical protein
MTGLGHGRAERNESCGILGHTQLVVPRLESGSTQVSPCWLRCLLWLWLGVGSSSSTDGLFDSSGVWDLEGA